MRFARSEVMQGSIGLEGGSSLIHYQSIHGSSLHFEIRKSMSAYSHVDPVTYLFETTEEEDESSGDETVNFKIDESRVKWNEEKLLIELFVYAVILAIGIILYLPTKLKRYFIIFRIQLPGGTR